ncbi:MAG: hypothetical protein QW376_08825, partial [Candidatus Caldarchaeum sp.]
MGFSCCFYIFGITVEFSRKDAGNCLQIVGLVLDRDRLYMGWMAGLAMIGKSQAVLLALLLALPTAFLGAAVLTTQAQTTYSAWLKIVTDSWNGVPFSGFTTPANGTFIGGFADKYNATNVCVFLVHFKANLTQWDPPVSAGSPNGTGFIQVSWP